MGEAEGRVFLFLQGPHGPFFRRLALRLAGQGAAVRRIAFNPGDEAEWARAGPLDRYLGQAGGYTEWLDHYITHHGVTDIVLYGDSRAEHAQAIALARPRGVLCHCLEEGYLRPRHVTYERWGTNGNSRLNEIPLASMARALGAAAAPEAEPEDGWGAHRAHLWHSALYHARLLLPSRRYGRHRSRRDISIWRELALYARRLAGLPLRRLVQGWRGRQLIESGRDYHLVLLQLSFDSAMQAHSDYRNSAEFVTECIDGFASGAPTGDVLVFKSHPFEDGRERLRRVIDRRARERGVAKRVLFLDGGPGLAPLLDGARSVVTINSTAAQQALWRGLPVAALGRSVYARPRLVSGRPLALFFAAPRRPDQQAYWEFRRFLTCTSQIEGSFYSRAGISALVNALPAALLSPQDSYDRVLAVAEPAPPDSQKLAAARAATPEQPWAQRQPQRLAV